MPRKPFPAQQNKYKGLETAEHSDQGGGLQGRLGLAVSLPTRPRKWFNISQPHFPVYKIGIITAIWKMVAKLKNNVAKCLAHKKCSINAVCRVMCLVISYLCTCICFLNCGSSLCDFRPFRLIRDASRERGQEESRRVCYTGTKWINRNRRAVSHSSQGTRILVLLIFWMERVQWGLTDLVWQ